MEALLTHDESAAGSSIDTAPSHDGTHPAVVKIDNFLNDEHHRQVYGFLARPGWLNQLLEIEAARQCPGTPSSIADTGISPAAKARIITSVVTRTAKFQRALRYAGPTDQVCKCAWLIAGALPVYDTSPRRSPRAPEPLKRRTDGAVMPSSAPVRVIAIAVLLTALPGAVALADSLPKLDVTASCTAAARGPIGLVRDKALCLAQEHSAEDTLAKGWLTYDAADKTKCSGYVKMGGPGSYVELLSCLEIMRDVKEVRQAEQPPAEQRPAASATVRRRR